MFENGIPRGQKLTKSYGSSGRWAEERRHQEGLYPGQKEALTYRMEGMTNGDIGAKMGISPRTVTSYLVGARVFLGLETIEEAVHEAFNLGEIPFHR